MFNNAVFGTILVALIGAAGTIFSAWASARKGRHTAQNSQMPETHDDTSEHIRTRQVVREGNDGLHARFDSVLSHLHDYMRHKGDQ